jgi:hypothetical protein
VIAYINNAGVHSINFLIDDANGTTITDLKDVSTALANLQTVVLTKTDAAATYKPLQAAVSDPISTNGSALSFVDSIN